MRRPIAPPRLKPFLLPLLLLLPAPVLGQPLSQPLSQGFGLQAPDPAFGQGLAQSSLQDLALDPPPVQHRIEGRFGVAYIREAGAASGQLEPLAGLRYTLTLNRQFDSGARMSFSIALQGEHLPPGMYPARPW